MDQESIKLIEELIYGRFRKRVNIQSKRSYVSRGGKNFNVGLTTKSTIWTRGGNETYINSNLINTVSSSSPLDNQLVELEGHTVDSSGNFSVEVQKFNLNGINKVTLPFPLARSEVLTNLGSTNLTGDLYVYENTTTLLGVPIDINKVHLKVLAADNRSFKSGLTTANQEFLVLTSLSFGVYSDLNNGKRNVNAKFNIEIRPKGGVFINFAEIPLSSNRSYNKLVLEQPAIISPNSDFRITATVSRVGVQLTSFMHGYFAQEV